jgi:hypothetical protein
MAKLAYDEKPWHGNNFYPIRRSDIPSLFSRLGLFGGVGRKGHIQPKRSKTYEHMTEKLQAL